MLVFSSFTKVPSLSVVDGIVCHPYFPSRMNALIISASESVGNELDSMEEIHLNQGHTCLVGWGKVAIHIH